jgi:hypothetical protein
MILDGTSNCVQASQHRNGLIFALFFILYKEPFLSGGAQWYFIVKADPKSIMLSIRVLKN